jgi:predicted aspartyl protease
LVSHLHQPPKHPAWRALWVTLLGWMTGSQALAANDGREVEFELELPPELAPSPMYAAPTTSDHVGRIVAPVMVNGTGPYRFIVDTGASHSAISPALVERLGLVVSEEIRLTVQSSTGSDATPTVLIDKLQAGDMVLTRHRVPVISQQVLAGMDGILGVEGFDKLRVTVDFGKDRINISRYRDRNPAGNWYRVPVEFKFGRLMIANGKVGRVAVKAVIDTGAERSLGNLALRTALRLDEAAQQEHTESWVIGATAIEQAANTIASPRVVIGQIALVDVDVTYADLNVFRLWDLDDEPAMIVGMDVLGTVRALMFDYRRREMMIRLEGAFVLRRDQG